MLRRRRIGRGRGARAVVQKKSLVISSDADRNKIDDGYVGNDPAKREVKKLEIS